MENEWIEWNVPPSRYGKGANRPGDFDVDYKLRMGKIVYNNPAESLFWDNRGNDYDIVAYRKSYG